MKTFLGSAYNETYFGNDMKRSSHTFSSAALPSIALHVMMPAHVCVC